MTTPTTKTNRLMFTVAALVVYWGMLFIATHLPVDNGFHGHVSDKVLHFVAYAGLTFLLASVLTGTRWRGPTVYYAVFVIASAYGAVEEGIQSYVPNRQPDFADWLADVAGAMAGLVAFAMLRMVSDRAAKRAY